MKVPFFRPALGQAEIDEVADSLRSGWLTTGPKVARFEAAFAEAVGARRALGVNSCTAALHLAVEALGLAQSEAVLVPTMYLIIEDIRRIFSSWLPSGKGGLDPHFVE